MQPLNTKRFDKNEHIISIVDKVMVRTYDGILGLHLLHFHPRHGDNKLYLYKWPMDYS